MACRSPQPQARVDLTPGRASSACSIGAPPRSRAPASRAAAPARPFLPGYPILNRRTRLDHETLLPPPPDHDPTDQIHAYHFSLAILLKSPRILLKSTCNPVPFKTNSNQALFYSLRPLSFFKLEPAVHPWQFCTLDPRNNV